MRFLLTVVILFFPFSVVLAQDTPQFTVDTRLRITVSSPGPLVEIGLYRALTDTTLTLHTGSSPVTLPLAGISRMEWSRGRRPSLLGGTLGFIVGVSVGGVVACALNRDIYGVFCAGQNDAKLVVRAGLGGGAVLGAILFRRDQWHAVDLAQFRMTRH